LWAGLWDLKRKGDYEMDVWFVFDFLFICHVS
jgi:hypothetical protein